MNKKTLTVLITSLSVITLSATAIAGATYALFTSNATTNIAVTSGKVEVSAVINSESVATYSATTQSTYNNENLTQIEGGDKLTEYSGEYYYMPTSNNTFINGGSVEVNDDTITLDKITAGDKVEFDIEVENKSSVAICYRTVIECDGDPYLFGGLDFTVAGKSFNQVVYYASEWASLSANNANKTTVHISVSLPLSAGNSFKGRSTRIRYSIQAVQGNSAKNDGEIKTMASFIEGVDNMVETGNNSYIVATTADEDNKIKFSDTRADTVNKFEVTVPVDAVADSTTSLSFSINKSDSVYGNFTTEGSSQSDGAEYETYDINLEGLATNNEAAVTVSFFIGTGKSNVNLYHYNELINSDYDQDTGYITFETKSFSPFTIEYGGTANTGNSGTDISGNTNGNENGTEEKGEENKDGESSGTGGTTESGNGNQGNQPVTQTLDVSLENDILKWNTITDATNYKIYIGNEYLTEVSANLYDLKTANLLKYAATTIEITVKAVKESEELITSKKVEYAVSAQLEAKIQDNVLLWNNLITAGKYEINVKYGDKTKVLATVETNTYTINNDDLLAYTNAAVEISITAYNSENSLIITSNTLQYSVPAKVVLSSNNGTFSWNKVNGATKYVVYAGDNILFEQTAEQDTYSYTLTEDNLATYNGENVDVKVVALDSNGQQIAVSETTTYTVPLKLTMGELTITEGVLSWANVNKATKYVITFVENSVNIEPVETTENSYNLKEKFTASENERVITINVQAIAGDVTSNINVITYTIEAQKHETEQPEQPTINLSATTVTLTGDTLSWTSVENATGYEIFFNDGTQTLSLTGINGTSYDLSNLNESALKLISTVLSINVKAYVGDTDKAYSDVSNTVNYLYKGALQNSIMVNNSHMTFGEGNISATSYDGKSYWRFTIGKSGSTFDLTGKYMELDFTATNLNYMQITYRSSGVMVQPTKNGDWVNGIKLISDGNDNYKLIVAVDAYASATEQNVSDVYWTVQIAKSNTAIEIGDTVMENVKLYFYSFGAALSAPENVKYNSNTRIVSWNSVQNAANYQVSYDGTSWIDVYGTSYEVARLGTFTFKVRAVSEYKEMICGTAAEVSVINNTLIICDDSADLLQDSNIISASGTKKVETTNAYGTSKQSIAWNGVKAYENMFVYASLDKSVLTITKNGYIEFFIKDTGHTSDETDRVSGVALRLYNGSSNKVAGVQDVKAYKGSTTEYSAEYRSDAGNGWSYYRLPLTLFGTEGASFDRVRFATNATFDSGEIMYLDGLRIVGAGVVQSSDEEEDSLEALNYEAAEAEDKQYDL